MTALNNKKIESLLIIHLTIDAEMDWFFFYERRFQMNTIKSVKQWVWHFLLSQSKHLSPPHLWDFSRRSQEEKRTGSPRNTTSPPPSHVAEPYSPGLHVPEEFLVFCCCFLEKKKFFSFPISGPKLFVLTQILIPTTNPLNLRFPPGF